jgi:20S proteasome alpha/beta subunit
MTVCIAGMFTWKYDAAGKDVGKAVITASDRQITAGDVEYEPNQLKIGFLTPRVMIMIAGAYPLHSEALIRTQRRLVETNEVDPGEIAELYASFLRQIRARHASNIYLAPFGLDLESYVAKQGDLNAELNNELANQLLQYKGESTEAILVGSDDKAAYIYVVDEQLRVTCHNDVGFAAIGIGASHAKSALMQARYANNFLYPTALAIIYNAKKTAEIAPGVGLATDLYLVTRTGWTPVDAGLVTRAAEAYEKFTRKRGELALAAIGEINEYLVALATKTGASGIPATQEDKPEDEGADGDEEHDADLPA